MEDYIFVEKLVKVLVNKRFVQDLACPITEVFFQNINEVLFIKQIAVQYRWINLINEFPNEMASSPEMYLTCVIHACWQEGDINFNIFDRFLSIYSLITLMNEEILGRVGVKFSQIVPDLFMVLYKNYLSEVFTRRGGNRRFVQFINTHPYLKCECKMENILSEYFVSIPENFDKQIEKILCNEYNLPTSFKWEDAATDGFSAFWAQTILEHTKAEIPSFSEAIKLQMNMLGGQVVQFKDEKKNFEESLKSLELSVEQASKSNFGFPNINLREPIVDSAWCEKIIEAVIRHNHLKTSHHMDKNIRIKKDFEVILKRLEETITQLIKILEE